jgi:hypothetical protein
MGKEKKPVINVGKLETTSDQLSVIPYTNLIKLVIIKITLNI